MMRHGIAIAALTAAFAGCGDSGRTYSTDEVGDAFQRQGYVLVLREVPGNTVGEREGDTLVPRGRQPFAVFVASDAAVDEVWPDYERAQTSESFAARRANVIVLSYSNARLAASERERVVAALSSLRDRGARAEIAGRE